MNKKLISTLASLTAFLLLMTASVGFAAMGDIQNLTYQGMTADVLGQGESSRPDGKPDAVFTGNINGIGGAITGFQLKSEDGRSVWDTTAGNGIPGMQVKDGQGQVLTESSGSMPLTPFLLGFGFTITVPDDGSIARGGNFTLTVRFVDDSESSATVSVPATAQRQTSSVRITSAVWSDEERRDLTGKNKQLRGDGIIDRHARLVLQGNGTLTGIRVQSVRGDAAEWDTLPGSNTWLVAATSSGNVLNSQDGSIQTDVRGRTVLDLWMTDNGAIERGRSEFQVTLFFSDGTEARATLGRQSAPAAPETQGSFDGSARMLGRGSRDFVGNNEKRAGNGSLDWEADLQVNTPGTIVSMTVLNTAGGAGEWDTIPGNGRWLLGVFDGNDRMLNREDGSVSIPVSRSGEYRLRMENNGTLDNEGTRSKITLTYDDGRVLSREISPFREQPPAGERPAADNEIRLYPPRKASSSDYVSKSERPGRDGNVDWVFEFRIYGEGRVKNIVLTGKGSRDTVRWDTIPGNGFPLLGVLAPGKGGLLNRNNGTVRFDVPPHQNLQLFVADEGFLRRNLITSYEIVVTWDDGSQSRATL